MCHSCGQGQCEHTVWRQIFEEHNFRGFRGLALNRENYVPRNNAQVLEVAYVAATSASWWSIDGNLLLIRQSDDKLRNPRGPCQGIRTIREETRHAIWEPVKNGSYANVTPQQK